MRSRPEGALSRIVGTRLFDAAAAACRPAPYAVGAATRASAASAADPVLEVTFEPRTFGVEDVARLQIPSSSLDKSVKPPLQYANCRAVVPGSRRILIRHLVMLPKIIQA